MHEVVDVATRARTRKEPELIVEHRPRASKDAHDDSRNLRILDRLYNSGDRSPRTLYYRANELRDNERHEEAVSAYLEVLQTQQPGWERYFALMSLAECRMTLERYGEATQAAMEAVRLDPARPEAWMVAGMVHYRQTQWERAVPFFTAATMARSRPSEGFLREADYGWAPWDYVSVCLGNSGRHAEALHAGQLALNGNPQPDRVRKNLAWFVSCL